MANYAFRDEERTDAINAEDAIREDKNTRFYCPDKKCTAHMYICSVDGLRRSYFAATRRDHPHVEDCNCSLNDIEFNPDLFNKEAFRFDDALDNLFQETNAHNRNTNRNEYNIGEVEAHPPRTLKQIYSLCKSYAPSYKYGDKEIGEMILDEMTLFRYPRGFFGKRIIEAATAEK